MSDDDNIKRLPIRFKKPGPEGRTLIAPHEVGKRVCSHLNCHFIVDESRDTVECADCGERMNPMWVLARLCSRDSMFHAAHAKYRDEMKRLNERQSTKCRHCGQMTRISHA